MDRCRAISLSAARVIVTRPERDALRWVDDLRRLGFAADALPLIEIAALPDPAPLRQVWEELHSYAALMFVSGHAVDGFLASNAARALQWRENIATDSVANRLRFLAPGPGTVTALLDAGVGAAQIDAPAADASQFDSEALWAVVGGQAWQGRRVLIVRGQGAAGSEATPGRDWLARQFTAAGARVDMVAVYRRLAPVLTAPQLQLMRTASRDGSVWLFSSSESVAHLPPHDWSGSCAIATHPRIAKAVRAAGWGVVAESRPTLSDIVASIESMQP